MTHWATEYLEKTAALSGLISKGLFTVNLLSSALNPAASDMLPSVPNDRRKSLYTQTAPRALNLKSMPAMHGFSLPISTINR